MLPEAEDQNDSDNILDSFELDRDQITVVRLLGSGNFGQVSKAIYGGLDVAVKSLKGIVCILLFTSFFAIYKYFIRNCERFSNFIFWPCRSHW